MKRQVLLAALCAGAFFAALGFLPPPSAQASENLVASLNDGGAFVRTFNARGAGMRAITFQCPGQTVYVRAGTSGSVADAGPGDVSVSFVSSPDSYPFPLASALGQDRIFVRRDDAGTLECYFYQVAQ